MSHYIKFYFNASKEAIVERFFLDTNPFGMKNIRKSGGSLFGESEKRIFQVYDAENYARWEFYAEMERIFHFKAKSILETGQIYTAEEVRERRTFADLLDEQKIPFYLLAHTGHNAQVLIRGLTAEKEGIMNPQCNTHNLPDIVLGLIEGLPYRQEEFGKDYLAK